MDQPPARIDGRSDAELLRAYLDPDSGDDGEAFNAIYCRYRVAVRRCLESEGLPPLDAENRVGTVFIRILDRDRADLPESLADVLIDVARQVACDTNWKPCGFSEICRGFSLNSGVVGGGV